MDSILTNTALFQGVEATAVNALVERLDLVDVRPGHVFFREGDQGDRMFVILAGKVKVGGHSPDGREGMFTLRGPSESFGELSVFDPGPRMSTALALDETRVAPIDGVLLRAWIGAHPEVADRLLRVLARRLRRTDDNLCDLIFTECRDAWRSSCSTWRNGSACRRTVPCGSLTA